MKRTRTRGRQESDGQTYNQTYYQQNKDKIRERRRKRYKEDPEYRKGVLQRSRKHYRDTKKKVSPMDRRVVNTTGGDKLFSIGKLAVFINRKIQTIRSYHRRGVIPMPNKYDRRGWRLYTTKQVTLCKAAFEKLDKGIYSSLDQVADFLKDRWEED